MGPFYVGLHRKAAAALESLPADRARAIRDRLQELAVDPRPRGTKKLRGSADVYRSRVGMYRIVYTVDDKAREVFVTDIATRQNIY